MRTARKSESRPRLLLNDFSSISLMGSLCDKLHCEHVKSQNEAITAIFNSY